MPSLNQLFGIALPVVTAVGGILLGVIGSFGSGFVKEFFDERARKAQHKREVARHVLQICNEASTCSYRHSPRDVEKINSTLTNLEGFDHKACVTMEKFSSSWQCFAREHSKGKMTPEDVRFAKEQLDDAEEARKILVPWANKIRIG